MRRLEHCNIVKLKYFFYSSGDKKDEVYLNLVLEYIPETVYKVARHYSKSKQTIPVSFIKVSVTVRCLKRQWGGKVAQLRRLVVMKGTPETEQ